MSDSTRLSGSEPESTTRTAPATRAFACLTLIVLTACSPSIGPGPDTTEFPVSGQLSPLVTVGLDAEAHPLQEEILSDGFVSHAEMERALVAVVSCVSDEGFTVTLADFSPGRGWQFAMEAASEEVMDAVDRTYEYCYRHMLSHVEARYLEQHTPTASELAEEHQRMVECLQDYGYDLGEIPIEQLALEVAPEDMLACDE